MSKPRVLLADDHTLMLEGIRRLLETDFDLVGSVRDGRSLVKSVGETKPDVVLLDISMPALNGIDAARQIRKLAPSTRLVFLTMHADRDYVVEAFRAGASGYILKWSAQEELSDAIRTVLRGRLYIPAELPHELLDLVSRR